MATLLDIGLLEEFGGIFPFLLVLVLTYALFLRIKWFGENKALSATVAFVLALMATLSPVASRAIQLVAPYYIILLIALFFVTLAIMSLGATEKNIANYIFEDKQGGWVGWTVGGAAVVIMLWGFGKALAEENLIPGLGEPVAGSAQEQIFYQIMLHPKVMGMIFIMVVGIFTINRLAAE